MTPPATAVPPARKGALEHVASLLSWQPRYRVLHATMFAFMLSFIVWFNFAPFALAIGEELGLTKSQLAVIGLANIAVTVPARIAIGMLLDRFGPRRLYSGLLIFAFIPNTAFAMAENFTTLVLSRLALGVVGAGFVVGIRMVAEWFESDEIGTAEGYYGGWGNFGSAAAALLLPTVATMMADGPGAWRWGVFVSGVMSLAYGIAYLFIVKDTPEGVAYQRPQSQGALEVTSRGAVFGLVALQAPLYAVLGYVTFRIYKAEVIGLGVRNAIYLGIAALFAFAAYKAVKVNKRALAGGYGPEEQYPFRSVVLLSIAYSVTFGTELTVIALLPTYFATTFDLTIVAASAAGSAFAFTNLVTRPGGGVLSDVSPSRKLTLVGLLVGSAVCFVGLSRMSSEWPLWGGIALIALASVFIQGGNGAVFAMAPLVAKRVGGQIAGLAGAYGNLGGLLMGAVLFFTIAPSGQVDADGNPIQTIGDTSLLFLVIAAAALVVAGLCAWLLPEPKRGGAVEHADADALVEQPAREQTAALPETVTLS